LKIKRSECIVRFIVNCGISISNMAVQNQLNGPYIDNKGGKEDN
jgi:hypothetical protein